MFGYNFNIKSKYQFWVMWVRYLNRNRSIRSLTHSTITCEVNRGAGHRPSIMGDGHFQCVSRAWCASVIITYRTPWALRMFYTQITGQSFSAKRTRRGTASNQTHHIYTYSHTELVYNASRRCRTRCIEKGLRSATLNTLDTTHTCGIRPRQTSLISTPE